MRIVKDTYDKLFPFQKKGVSFLSKTRSALLADQLGIGKTVQALHACQEVGADRVLVICSASIKYNWFKEAVKWGFDADDIHIVDRDTIDFLPEEGMFIVNYDLIWRKRYSRVLAKREYDVLICDECHALKNKSTRRAKAVWNKGGYCDLAIYRWMLTATPVLNRPVELYAMLNKLCHDRLGGYKNYISYTKRYCNGKDGHWGWDASGATNLEELAGRLDGFMLRRTRDVLPNKTLQKIYMPTSKEIKEQLFKGEEDGSIRRKIGVGKVKLSAEHIMDILEDEPKVLVFAYHREVIEGLEKELSAYKPVKLYGGTPIKKRQEAIEKFRTDDETRVFIGQIQAAGEGIDGLQEKCSVGVFVEICHTPGTINQAIGRLHRQGQTGKTLFQFLIVENTIDEQILDSTILKEENIKTIMKDDTIGLDFSEKTNNKEEEMSMESEMKRVADALEGILEFIKTPIAQEGNVQTVKTVETEDEEKPKKKKKKRKKKEKKTEKKELPKTEENYSKKINDYANLISGFYGDAEKTNKTFAELTSVFKEQFPQYPTVVDVKEDDQPAVIKLIDEFLKEKGVS